jgi:hypothetical protein
MRGQQLEQQGRAAGVQIRGPTDLAACCDLCNRGYEFEECVFVVLGPFREQHRPCLIDHAQ